MALGDGEYGVMGREVGIFQLHGVDARDLLQRLTSNQLLVQAPAVIDNLFPDMNGRIVAPAQMWWLRHGDYFVVERGLIGRVATWLEEMTFREDARFELREDVALLTTILSTSYEATARPAESLAEGHRTTLWGDRFVRETLSFAQLPLPEQTIDAAQFRYFAFANGGAMRLADVVIGRNPHEANLSGWLSDQKGCYCGQEVIARLETYQKVQRHLRVFAVEGSVEATQLFKGLEPVAELAGQANLPGEPTLLAAYTKNSALGEHELTLQDGRVARRVPGY